MMTMLRVATRSQLRRRCAGRSRISRPRSAPGIPRGPSILARLAPLEAAAGCDGRRSPGPARQPTKRKTASSKALAALSREALLANPLLDFDKLLLVQRGDKAPNLGCPTTGRATRACRRPATTTGSPCSRRSGRDGQLTTLYKPDGGRFVGDVDLHFDAERMLFSMPGKQRPLAGLRDRRRRHAACGKLTGEQPDVDSYDACYLPDGQILFTSTACFVGVPCVYGSSHVANLYRMDADGRNIRQLCFDQEHDWCPTVLNNGRVLYSRWEYTDTPHSNTRLLFHMNPDGTEPGGVRAAAIPTGPTRSSTPGRFPDHPTKVVAVIGGHHDNPRMGELVMFDPAQGRHEADGASSGFPATARRSSRSSATG